MWFRKRKPTLSREQALAAIPVPNPTVTASRDDDGHVLLTLRRQHNWRTGLLSVLFRVPKQKVIELDDRGSFVWNLSDGQTTVRQVIDTYRQRYSADRRNWKEAELQVVQFLRMLAQKRLIAMAIVEKKDKSPADSRSPQSGRRKNKKSSKNQLRNTA